MTTVHYLPLIDMIPSHPDTVLTTMHLVKSITDETGQKYTIFTSDQQLSHVTVQMTWFQPNLFSNFIPCLEGMHMLMSFIGSVGTLMGHTGVQQILETTFSGVNHMLCGKKFPQNMRALHLLVEEVLREILGECGSYSEMMALLEEEPNGAAQPSFGLIGLIV